jgi:hypothetical protein
LGLFAQFSAEYDTESEGEDDEGEHMEDDDPLISLK